MSMCLGMFKFCEIESAGVSLVGSLVARVLSVSKWSRSKFKKRKS
jgi:hypothetical protein